MRYRIPAIFYVIVVGLWACGMTIFLVHQHAFSRWGSRLAENARIQELERAEAGHGARNGNALHRLEDSLMAGTFSSKNALESMEPPMRLPLPVQQAPTQNRRSQNPLDDKYAWMFMTPQEISALPTPEQMFNLPEYGPDGLEKKKLSSAERYYQSLKLQQEGSVKGNLAAMENVIFGSSDVIARKNDATSSSDENLPAGVRESQKRLKDLVNDSRNRLSSTLTRDMGSSIFDFGDKGPSVAEQEAHQEYMKRFRDEVLNSRPASSPDPLAALANPVTQDPAAGLPSTVAARRTPGYDPQLGGVSATYIPSGSLDVNSKVVNGWNPAYTPPPPPQASKPLPPPGFEAPRRKF
jgi:hypothetical protein